jgi:teichuronic acid biosynthesis protein TuaE
VNIRVKTIFCLLLISAVIGPALSYSKVYLFHIVLAVFLLSILFVTDGKISFRKLPTDYHLFFAVMLIWYALTVLWSPSKALTLTYLGYILLGSILAIIIIRYSKNLTMLNSVALVLCGIFCVDMLIGLLEFLTDFRWPISAYSQYACLFGREIGYDPNWPSTTLYALSTLPTGFHWNPNNFATVMNILLPFFLFHQKKMIKFCGSILIVILIIAASSRANIIASLLIISVYLLFYNRKRGIVSLYVIVSAVCICSLLVINIPSVGESFTHNKVASESLNAFDALKVFLTEDQTEPTSIGIRQSLVKEGINAIKDSYGLGLGGGTSRLIKVGDIENMHFFWLEIVVEAGILFAFLFFIWYVSIVFSLYKISKVCKDSKIKYYASASSLSLIGFIFGAVSASSTIYMLPMWILYGFAISTINVYRYMTYNSGSRGQMI